MKKLELFKFDACPFCQRVMGHINKNQIKVDFLDIMMDPQALKRLTTDTGRRTTPCLYIDNKPMFESVDIIAWLDQNIDKLEKNS